MWERGPAVGANQDLLTAGLPVVALLRETSLRWEKAQEFRLGPRDRRGAARVPSKI